MNSDQNPESPGSSDAPESGDALLGFRQEIDETDRDIVRLILRRAELAKAIGEAKRKQGGAVYRPDREKEVYKNIAKIAGELYGAAPPFPVQILEHVYREIMSGSIAIEGGPRVAYLGPESSFSHLATRFRFGASVAAVPVDTIPAVFRAVEAGRDVSFGVVPVENTIEGPVGITLDSFINSELKVYAEHYIRVELNLLAPLEPAKWELSDIRKVYTIRIAREQCRNWLENHLNMRNVEVVETSSTAAAAKLVAERGDGVAVASELSAETYGLQILRRSIQDSPHNVTRFFVLGREQCPPTGEDKTTIMCTLRDKPGSLYNMLNPFEERGVNLTRIESRPNRSTLGGYNFFTDFLGHHQEARIQEILAEVEEHTTTLKVLGSFPSMKMP
ncbi:MAG: prephenate dehydratase [bacterium]|nr:prephenate dehydratase [bacterium]